jgi:hypothetical protein
MWVAKAEMAQLRVRKGDLLVKEAEKLVVPACGTMNCRVLHPEPASGCVAADDAAGILLTSFSPMASVAVSTPS